MTTQAGIDGYVSEAVDATAYLIWADKDWKPCSGLSFASPTPGASHDSAAAPDGSPRSARRLTPAGVVVLLSSGAPSFDQFGDYAQCGRHSAESAAWIRKPSESSRAWAFPGRAQHAGGTSVWNRRSMPVGRRVGRFFQRVVVEFDVEENFARIVLEADVAERDDSHVLGWVGEECGHFVD